MLGPITRALSALALTLAFAAPAAAEVPSNADWHEFYISDALPYPAGEPTLHADLLVPKGTDLSKDKLPVIVSVGPYFGHGGSSSPATSPNNDGPQLRWRDLIEGGRIFERGYALLQVDLRGFGGSQGCNDFGGRGEQIDVKRAVEWAASQPWSLGDVALYGKSYDGWTGVMGLDEKPEGLGAAIIQSPIIDGYRTLYMDGVHYNAGWYQTPALYQQLDFGPPAVPDITQGRYQYVAGFATGTNPACYATNIALQNGVQKHDDAAGFWRERDLPAARGSDIPVFWSHGFLDVNTKPDNFESVWSTLEGPKRAWFGQFAHTRPNEAGVGRHQYYWGELFAFLDEHLRGRKRVAAPAVEVEDSDGRWRAEKSWPPADGVSRSVTLRPGKYSDLPTSSAGVWSITEPLRHDAWIAGVPQAAVNLTTTLPDANVIVSVWDIAQNGQGLLITRGAGKYTGTGTGTKTVELYPADYVIHAGHRIGVFVSNADSLYLPTPSGQDVTVSGGALRAPFLRRAREEFLPGEKSRDSSQRPKRTLTAATIAGSPTTWEIPKPMTDERSARSKRRRR